MYLFGTGYRQRYKPKKVSQKKSKVSEFIIDETLLKVCHQYVWVWVAIDLIGKEK